MADANGDYIKVYLFMLRHRGEKYGIKDAADALNLTDNDVQRAIRYWEKQGVFSEKEMNTRSAGSVFDAENSENFIKAIAKEAETGDAEGMNPVWPEGSMPEDAEEQAFCALPEMGNAAGTAAAGNAAASMAVHAGFEELENNEEFEGILFVARHTMPNLPTGKQVECLQFMYRDLKMSAELIEFLVEYCATIGKTSARYMQAVAIAWHEQGIADSRQAQNLIRSFGDNRRKTAKRSSGKQNRFHNFQQSDSDYESAAKKKVFTGLESR
jgi:DnaD/phage-associated family protein